MRSPTNRQAAFARARAEFTLDGVELERFLQLKNYLRVTDDVELLGFLINSYFKTMKEKK